MPSVINEEEEEILQDDSPPIEELPFEEEEDSFEVEKHMENSMFHIHSNSSIMIK